MSVGRDIRELTQYSGHCFRNISYLQTALTHTSFANECKKEEGVSSYQRFEFLGDAILQMAVSRCLFERFPQADEGMLTRFRQHLVCEEALAGLAKRLHLGEFLLLGNGEELNRGREHAPILADAFEALLAAIYLDVGCDMEYLYTYLQQLMKEEIAACGKSRGGDYKTRLQQLVQQDGKERLYYTVVSETGPSHQKTFLVHAMLNSNCIGRGVGSSVPKAEQAAAREALALFGEHD